MSSVVKYDVAVIGGGPAGMMAAGRAGESGGRVILLEKNARLGVKLLATGGGRCNLTNHKSPKELIGQYGPNGKFLYSALHRFGAEAVMDFFSSRGVVLKTEDNDRVFPKSDKAGDVLDVLIGYLRESKVDIRLGTEVKEIVKQGNAIENVILSDGVEISADKFIITTGGRSYPQTGSTGDGYDWLRQLGHTVVTPQPALAPLTMRDNFIKELQGVSLPGVSVSVYDGQKKIAEGIDDVIFTNDGLSGPAVLNLSKVAGQIRPGATSVKLDFFPQHDPVQLDKLIQRLFRGSNNKLASHALDGLLPSRLAAVMIGLAGINKEKQINLITREERSALTAIVKGFTLESKASAGFDKAMATAGGASLSEVDPQTMKSKVIENLYLAGEILDLDGPTGGYNLQIAWSTGHIAGIHSSQNGEND